MRILCRGGVRVGSALDRSLARAQDRAMLPVLALVLSWNVATWQDREAVEPDGPSTYAARTAATSTACCT